MSKIHVPVELAICPLDLPASQLKIVYQIKLSAGGNSRRWLLAYLSLCTYYAQLHFFIRDMNESIRISDSIGRYMFRVNMADSPDPVLRSFEYQHFGSFHESLNRWWNELVVARPWHPH